MNPSFKLVLILLIAGEVSFTNKLFANLIFALAFLIYLLWKRISWRQLMWSLIIPLVPGLAMMVTIGIFGNHDWWTASVMLTRFYVYVLAGSSLVFTTNRLDLVRSLEQNCHFSSKFAYGILAALNLLPTIKRTLTTIRLAGQMRGVNLHWWSPTLYFKAILAAMRWSDQLAQAMEMHGFKEGQPRTNAIIIPIKTQDWCQLLGIVGIFQVILIALP